MANLSRIRLVALCYWMAFILSQLVKNKESKNKPLFHHPSLQNLCFNTSSWKSWPLLCFHLCIANGTTGSFWLFRDSSLKVKEPTWQCFNSLKRDLELSIFFLCCNSLGWPWMKRWVELKEKRKGNIWRCKLSVRLWKRILHPGLKFRPFTTQPDVNVGSGAAFFYTHNHS